MTMTGESADDTEGEFGSCRSVCGGVPACHGRNSFMFSLVILIVLYTDSV